MMTAPACLRVRVIAHRRIMLSGGGWAGAGGGGWVPGRGDAEIKKGGGVDTVNRVIRRVLGIDKIRGLVQRRRSDARQLQLVTQRQSIVLVVPLCCRLLREGYVSQFAAVLSTRLGFGALVKLVDRGNRVRTEASSCNIASLPPRARALMSNLKILVFEGSRDALASSARGMRRATSCRSVARSAVERPAFYFLRAVAATSTTPLVIRMSGLYEISVALTGSGGYHIGDGHASVEWSGL